MQQLFLRGVKKEDSVRALLLQFVEDYMKMRIDQYIISIQGIYRQHLQLAEAECAPFLPHEGEAQPLLSPFCWLRIPQRLGITTSITPNVL